MDAMRRKNLKALLIAGTALAASSSLAIFAVPLYELFCQVTGYGGTTQQAEESSRDILDRRITVRFDASVDADLPWRFEPVQRTQTVQVGKSALSHYRAVNTSARAITGTAVFNVTPHKAGQYFSKIECFCFTEQTLAPGEAVDMPVTWFIDPAINEDDNLDDIAEITLSYTFFFSDYADQTMARARSEE